MSGEGEQHQPAGEGPESCFRCSASLSQPLVCEGCGLLQKAPEGLNPFQTLGLKPAAEVDAGDLRKRQSKLSRQMHPDFFVAEGEAAKRQAEANTAQLNSAFEVVSDESRRFDWLIEDGGGPSTSDERQMPQEFLMEVLEWNETLEGAREGDAEALAKLPALAGDLESQRNAEQARLRQLLTPLPPTGDERYRTARRGLNAIRYLERALAEIAERQLDTARGTTSTD